MRVCNLALCGTLLLSLALPAGAASSPVHKKHAAPAVAAKGKTAHKADNSARGEKSSRTARKPEKKTSHARRGTHAASRNAHHEQQAIARASVQSARHHRMTRGERRLAQIREREFALRQAAPLETEAIERHGYLEDESQRREMAAALPPSPLKGSRESLVRQNERSEAEGLERIEDDDDLNDRIATGALVPLPASANLAINGNLPENRRYCRPWTADFLRDLSRAHASSFSNPLMVTSAVRTVEYQKKLKRVNGNAAAAEGDIASPHLTGASIDIAKSPMSRKEIAWMRRQLLAMQKTGHIDVEEEFKQSCFHITVYNTYEPQPAVQPRSKRRLNRAAAHATPPPATGDNASGE